MSGDRETAVQERLEDTSTVSEEMRSHTYRRSYELLTEALAVFVVALTVGYLLRPPLEQLASALSAGVGAGSPIGQSARWFYTSNQHPYIVILFFAIGLAALYTIVRLVLIRRGQ